LSIKCPVSNLNHSELKTTAEKVLACYLYSNMILRVVIIFLFTVFFKQALAQTDSTRVMEEVVITAYKTNRPLTEVPASIGVVNQEQLLRFNNTSLLPAVNTIPGVRMEERSPGSFRFAIRGSSLRSPFGVRNVKFYWNGLPITDGGGNTYLNLLDPMSVGSMEIIKGPGASLYGAGTGGVVLLKSPEEMGIRYGFSAGSYGLRTYSLGLTTAFKKHDYSSGISYQKSDGYRDQSAMKRLIVYANLRLYPNAKNYMGINFFSSAINYETPGGLTLTQYEEDARQARPKTPTMASAQDQQAAVSNWTSLFGFTLDHYWTKNFNTKTILYGSGTEFKNPTIRNYEMRTELNGGLRTETQYILKGDVLKSKFTAGAELQFFGSDLNVYSNVRGNKGDTLSMDHLKAKQYLFFAQSEIDFPHDFYVTLGASFNSLKYKDQQLVKATNLLERDFKLEVSPRVAILKKINRSLSVYGNISRGFSPPTFAEALPSTGIFNSKLNAERGVSYEIGARGSLFNRIEFDVAAYDFRLKDAIVIQRAADGSDYFVNAGSTKQQGLEAKLSWNKYFEFETVRHFGFWTTAALNHYRFGKYEQSGNDYSGNPITGVAPDLFGIGGNLVFSSGFYLNVTSSYTDHISLNDAANEHASDYVLLGARGGYRKELKKIRFEIYTGIDNALDEKYSLGNDLNATGGRYYNVAPGRNYYFGVKLAIK
jgi:iron complex outermembrane receptor protein